MCPQVFACDNWDNDFFLWQSEAISLIKVIETSRINNIMARKS